MPYRADLLALYFVIFAKVCCHSAGFAFDSDLHQIRPLLCCGPARRCSKLNGLLKGQGFCNEVCLSLNCAGNEHPWVNDLFLHPPLALLQQPVR